jgi:hypothetical protein
LGKEPARDARGGERESEQVVVVTLDSLQGYPIEDYGYQLGRHWGIGQKGTNTGALLITESSMPSCFSFTLSTNSLSAAALSAPDCSRRLHVSAASRTAGISAAPTPRLQAMPLNAV